MTLSTENDRKYTLQSLKYFTLTFIISVVSVSPL